jgi:hypothetical protein
MKKNSVLLFFVFVISILLATYTYAKDVQVERSYLKLGYTAIDSALKESKKHFKKDIALPSVVPISFNQSFGRVVNQLGFANDYFEVVYLDSKNGNNHYKIEVRPLKYKLPIEMEKVDEVVILNNGTKALYGTNTMQGFHCLIFEVNDWQYMLALDNDASDQNLQTLLDVANSIESK